jgi:hypothetical protein
MKPTRLFPALTVALLVSASLPAIGHANTLTVTDITVEGDNGFKLVVPTIEVTDGNLDEAAIRGLVTSAEQLAALDAASLRIPEIIMSYAMPGVGETTWEATTIYRDLELKDVKDGIAGAAALGGIETVGAPNSSVFSLGKMSTDRLDISALLGLNGIGSANADAAMRPVYENFELDGGTISGPLLHCTIRGASADGLSARPLKGTQQELMQYTTEIAAAEANGQTPPMDALLGAVRYYADVLTAFEASATEFGGFNCTGGRPDQLLAITAGPSSLGAIKPGIYPSMSLNDLRVDIPNQGWLELGNVTWKTMDMGDALETLTGTGEELNEAWLAANWRKLLPAVEGFSISGFAMDIADEANSSQRLVAGIDAIDLTLADYTDGIPTSVSTTGNGLRLAWPETPGQDLLGLGIDEIDLDFALASQWDQKARTISLENVALTANGLGGISLSGTIANAGPELFSYDANVANAALAALTVTELKIDIENAGMVPLAIAAAATEQKVQPEELRLTLSGMAQALPLAVLGATPDATGLGQSLGAFFNGAPNLSITLTSTDPAGIGLAELMAAEKDPSILKDKVRIMAEASGQSQPFTYPDVASMPANSKS